MNSRAGAGRAAVAARLALAFLLWCAAPLRAQPEAPPPLPFVGAAGVVAGNLTYGDLLAALGRPMRATLYQDLSVDHHYAERGLSFRAAWRGDDGRDAPVRTMTVTAPSVAATPQGLRVGMSEAQALEVLARGYRVEDRSRAGGTWTTTVVDREGTIPRDLQVHFRAGAVQSLVFDLQDRSALSAGWRRWRMPALGAAAVLLMAAAWAVAAWRRRAPRAQRGVAPTAQAQGRSRPSTASWPKAPAQPSASPSPAPAQLRPAFRPPSRDDGHRAGTGLGWVLLALALMCGAGGWLFGPRRGYEAFLTLIVVGVSPGLAFFGLVLLARSDRASWAAVGTVGAVLLGAAYIISKLVG